VGKKTAQRLVVDLKDKFSLPFGRLGAGESARPSATLSTGLPSPYGDLLAALEQLGYRGAEGRALAMQAHHNLGETAQTAQLLQEALRIAAIS
jgi:Holliday junction resolvasome RuvABC DNA-binding subunit